MNKTKIVFSILLLSVIVFISCEKVQEDKIPPIIILNGSNPDMSMVGSDYSDPGANTSDDKDGHGYRVSNNINKDSVGDYYLTYTAYDSDSNFVTKIREVSVKSLGSEFFVGEFYVHDTLNIIPRKITNYYVSVNLYADNPETYRMKNFNNYGDNFNVLFQPDSLGFFSIDYQGTDTIITGNGSVYTNFSGFRIEYGVQTQVGNYNHKATYEN